MSSDTHDNESPFNLDDYKAPIRKLAASFLRSRNSIREKYNELKKTIKNYKIKIRDLSKSRDKWKVVAKQLEKDLKKLRIERQEEYKKKFGADS